MEKELKIKINVVTGDVQIINDDEMTDYEVLGLLEFAKMLIYQNQSNNDE